MDSSKKPHQKKPTVPFGQKCRNLAFRAKAFWLDEVMSERMPTQLRKVRIGLVGGTIGIVFPMAAMQLGLFVNPYDFGNQVWFLSVMSIALIMMGMNVGYYNWRKKNFWAGVDVLWISLVVLGLGATLAPVKQVVLTNQLGSAQALSGVHFQSLRNAATLIAVQSCSKPAHAGQCASWSKVKNSLNNPGLTLERACDVVDVELKLLNGDATDEVHEKKIAGISDKLRESIKERDAAQKALSEVSIVSPYVKIFLVLFALGLRAGKSGAEFGKNDDEKQKDARTKEADKLRMEVELVTARNKERDDAVQRRLNGLESRRGRLNGLESRRVMAQRKIAWRKAARSS